MLWEKDLKGRPDRTLRNWDCIGISFGQPLFVLAVFGNEPSKLPLFQGRNAVQNLGDTPTRTPPKKLLRGGSKKQNPPCVEMMSTAKGFYEA
jgi:hypothetical protein